MNRFLSDSHLERLKNDFARVLEIIQESRGEYDLRLRANYLNLYSRGNSIARIGFTSEGYEVVIHAKFAADVFSKDNRFCGKVNDNYTAFQLPFDKVTPFFQKTYLQKISANVAKVGYSAELEFEQLLIADNL